MPRQTSSDELSETVSVYQANDGNQRKAAEALGIARTTLQGRLRAAELKGLLGNPVKSEMVELPSFVTHGDEEEDIEEVIDRMARQFERAKKAHDARQWFPIKFKEDKPVGLLFVGDPHVDDNGCNWPVLRRHIELAKTTDGMHAVNIGDSANDWGGRLIKKYADQDTSLKTANRLVEWLLLGSGMPWLVWLHGNHQHMGGSIPLHEQMNKRYGTVRVPMFDWCARFRLEFPNGEAFRINAAHDFPGNSQWNPNHGPVKAVSLGGDVDLAVTGHRHNWAISQWEMAEKGTTPLMVRVRGYKHLDDYARRIGKYEQEEGQSVLVVFDPASKTAAGRMVAFADIEKGAEYLAFVRR